MMLTSTTTKRLVLLFQPINNKLKYNNYRSSSSSSLASQLLQWIGFQYQNKPKITKRFVTSLEEEYDIVKILGTGRYGVVRSAYHKRDVLKTTPLAIKTVKKLATNDNPYVITQLKNEIEILDKVKNFKGVQSLVDSCEDETHVHIVTKMYDGGELFDRIVERGTFTDLDTRIAMRQILETIAFIHAAGVVHRDVKPENLLYSNIKPDADLVLIDFGMARTFTKGDRFELECGSPSYVAPEVLLRNYNEKCDLWSSGIVMHILLTGSSPFSNGTEEEILNEVMLAKDLTFTNNNTRWKEVSPDAKELVYSLLRVDPDKRPSAEECLSFKFIEPHTLEQIKTKREIDFDVPLHELKTLENLREFNLQRKLKKAALKVIAGLNVIKFNGTAIRPEALSTVHIDEKYLMEAFKQFDLSGDGFIDKGELKILLGASEGRVDENMLEEVMKDADIDGSGTISFEEFVRVMRKQQPLNSNTGSTNVAEVAQQQQELLIKRQVSSSSSSSNSNSNNNNKTALTRVLTK
jgi:calcium-dependent protein kinase